MATRNLSELYFRLHQQARRNAIPLSRRFSLGIEDDSVSILGRDALASPSSVTPVVSDQLQSDLEMQRLRLAPLWVDIKEDVEENLQKLEGKIVQLKRAHDARLKDVLGTKKADQEREISSLTKHITRRMGQMEKKIKQINPGSAGFGKENRVRTAAARELAQRLWSITSQFRQSQKAYQKELTAIKSGVGNLSGTGMIDFTEPVRVANLSQEQLLDEEFVQNRDDEINNIAKSITELAGIFKELTVLIVDQGTILDRIDYNLEVALEKSEQGFKELQKAEEYQKSNKSLKCIAILICLITVLMCLFIIKKTRLD
eukprot:g571.t1